MYALWNAGNGFYSFSLVNNGGVVITSSQHQALLLGESQGKSIFQGEDGSPTLRENSNSLQETRTLQKSNLKDSCQSYLYGGFSSNALGSTHFYPSNVHDQQNLSNIAATSSSASLWCEVESIWGLVVHTAQQIAQVNTDWVVNLNLSQNKLISLIAEVDEATSESAVLAIIW